jgi:UDP-GlcNAc:undecaprenyl-phosphate GlcNAc-1-phosphate transferase
VLYGAKFEAYPESRTPQCNRGDIVGGIPFAMKPHTHVFSLKRLPLFLLLVVLLIPKIQSWIQMHKTAYAFYLIALSCLLCYLLVPIAERIGFWFKLMDHPDEVRKQHKNPTPLTGGLAIYTAFAATILINFNYSIEMKAILVASTLIFVTGLFDDRFGLSAKFRLLVQILAALIVIYFGVRVTFVPDALGGVYVEYAITLLWIIGITNSMNFIDGMDGLAAGTCIIYASFYAIVSLLTHQPYMMFLAVAIAGGCLGFFPYNFRKNAPAQLFLGDSGATFLGFLMASFAILGEWGDSILDITIPVLIMSVLIFDMTLTTFVRIHSGEVKTFGQWLHYTGRDHFHHRLVSLGLDSKRAAILYFLVSICFGVEALTVLFANTVTSTLVLLHSALVFIILGIILVFGSVNPRIKSNGQDCATRD